MALAPTAPTAAAAPARPVDPKAPLTLTLEPLKAQYAANEPFAFSIQPNRQAYVYCYAREPSGKFQRIFPNRYELDPLIFPRKPMLLPGDQKFVMRSAPSLAVACLAASRDVYNDVPAALRWGDFQDLNAVRGFEEVKRMLEAVAKEPVALATLQVPMAAPR